MRIDMVTPQACQLGSIAYGDIFLSGGTPYMKCVPIDEPCDDVVWAARLSDGTIKRMTRGTGVIYADPEKCGVTIR